MLTQSTHPPVVGRAAPFEDSRRRQRSRIFFNAPVLATGLDLSHVSLTTRVAHLGPPAGQAGGASAYPSWPPHCGGDSQERTPDPQGKAAWWRSKISVCLWQGPAILHHAGFKAARTGTSRRTTCPLPPGQRQPRRPSGHTQSHPGRGLKRAPPHWEGP